MLDISPLKTVSHRDKPGYARQKVKKILEAAKSKMLVAMEIPDEEIQWETDDKDCSKCKDLDTLIALLAQKCKISSRRDKIKLLTLVPESWSKAQIMEKFNVSDYMVRQAKKLKKD